MTLSEDVNLEEYVMAKDDLSGADIKVWVLTVFFSASVGLLNKGKHVPNRDLRPEEH